MAKSERYDVILFTDGACSGNPGPGGWACILRHVDSGAEKRLCGGEPESTNNRMELTGVIQGLATLKTGPLRVQVVTDSQYVSRGMTEWLPGWLENDWRRGPKGKAGPVKNADLWKQLVTVCDRHRVDFVYIPGHTGHAENEECDRMAVEAAQQAAKGAR
ncbi:MAG: ribonuclease HI [Planctomycetota bacterium]|jgi:ribonuclease HI